MNNEISLFKSLSDGTRLDILKFLLKGERCVCEIFPKVNRTQSTVSIQLAKLESAGLISSRRDGKKIFYRIVDLRVAKILTLAKKKL
jgi:ArsR family transcriptional regulator